LVMRGPTRDHRGVMDEYRRYDPGMTSLERWRYRNYRTLRSIRRFVRGPLLAAVIAIPLVWMGWSALGTSSGGVSLPLPKHAKAHEAARRSTATTVTSSTTTIVARSALVARHSHG
jgi:hypothetical protein